jgi:hypothetical protein
MSFKDRTGRWVIPQEQLKEFNQGINYTELCVNCLSYKDQLKFRSRINQLYPGLVKPYSKPLSACFKKK